MLLKIVQRQKKYRSKLLTPYFFRNIGYES